MNTDHTEEKEILNTRAMLEDGFFSKLKMKPGSSAPTIVKEVKESVAINDTESLLLDLFEVRDGLIDIFKKANGSEQVVELLTGHIDKVGDCIRKLGGAVDKFDPLSAISGLRDPDLKLNAQRVVENTKQAYTLGKISDDKVSADGKIIHISFSGSKGNIGYKAVGTLVANKSWTGNEGVDFIYSPGSGKISVKAVSDDGKWIDKSSEYNISWELFEQDNSVAKEAKTEKIAETKKEVENPSVNNIEDEEIGDFPIEENK